MARGLADFIEVVRLAARAQALLRRGGAAVGHRDFAGIVGFELHHARAREQQRWVIARHERIAALDHVAALPEEVEVTRAYVVAFHCNAPIRVEKRRGKAKV